MSRHREMLHRRQFSLYWVLVWLVLARSQVKVNIC